MTHNLFLVLAALGIIVSALAAAQTTTTYDPTSKTLVFQLRAWQKPPVIYDEYYSKAGIAARGEPFCKVIGPVNTGNLVTSFEEMRRAVASTAGISVDWAYVFPQDSFISTFSVPSSEGWGSKVGNVTEPLTPSNASAATTPAPTTALAGARDFSLYSYAQVYAVWLLLQPVNSTTAITDAELQAAHKKLLAISTNIGDSAALASAAGPAFFGLQAMDFGTAINTAPMRTQVLAQHAHWLAVYNDEWDRFLVGMLATTIIGTAIYITAHFWIHKVKTHGALATAEGGGGGSGATKDGKSSNAAAAPGARSAADEDTPFVPPAAVPLRHPEHESPTVQ